MPELVVNGAQVMCTFGTSPSALTVVPAGAPIQAGGQVAAQIAGHDPDDEHHAVRDVHHAVEPAGGGGDVRGVGELLTPQPCIPVTTSPWTPGSTKVTVGGVPALTSPSTCMCTWGGSISVVQAGQVKVTG